MAFHGGAMILLNAELGEGLEEIPDPLVFRSVQIPLCVLTDGLDTVRRFSVALINDAVDYFDNQQMDVAVLLTTPNLNSHVMHVKTCI
jgi:hypothetical protein